MKRNETTEPHPGSEAIKLRITIFVRILAGTAILLSLISLAGQIAFYVFGYSKNVILLRMLNVDAEHNIPTAFSSALLLTAAVLLGVTAAAERKRHARDAAGWVILAIGFGLMALDEAAVLHEKLIPPMRRLIGPAAKGYFYYAWVVAALAGLLIVGLGMIGFLRRLEPKTRLAFLASAAIYLGGAVGLEFISGRHAFVYGTRNLAYQLFAMAEELLEMTGAVLFIRAVLVRLAGRFPRLAFRFEPGAGETASGQDFPESSDRRIHVGVADVFVGDESDAGSAGRGQSPDPPLFQPAKQVEDGITRMAELENDDVGLHLGRIELDPFERGDRFSQAPGPDMVFSEPLCHDGQGQEAGRGQDAGLAHPPAQGFPDPAAVFDELLRSDEHRADRRR